jgi:glycyl-tRNA synthetase beta subunit
LLYFVSYNNEGLSSIIAIFVEGNKNNIDNILSGNMKVLNARLFDAQFFYNKDHQKYISSL